MENKLELLLNKSPKKYYKLYFDSEDENEGSMETQEAPTAPSKTKSRKRKMLRNRNNDSRKRQKTTVGGSGNSGLRAPEINVSSGKELTFMVEFRVTKNVLMNHPMLIDYYNSKEKVAPGVVNLPVQTVSNEQSNNLEWIANLIEAEKLNVGSGEKTSTGQSTIEVIIASNVLRSCHAVCPVFI